MGSNEKAIDGREGEFTMSDTPLHDLNREDEEVEFNENRLRPKSFSEYVGQKAVTSRLEVFVKAAAKRQNALDHVLLSGPPGLGKTTLASIIARELGGRLHQVPGPTLDRSVDLMSILSNLEKGDILFVDEIHRLNAAVEESLYPAMEDFKVQLMIGEGAAAQPVTLPVQPFTLIGATTQAGKLTGPLRDRFGIQLNLEFYDVPEIQKILTRSSKILGLELKEEELQAIALRSRGTPRIANRLLSRVRDFLEVLNDDESLMSQEATTFVGKARNASSPKEAVEYALDFLEVDSDGLQALDRRYLKVLGENFQGGPAGIEAIAASLSESRSTLEEMVEPYLLKEAIIIRTPRGRQLTAKGFKKLGIDPVTNELPLDL